MLPPTPLLSYLNTSTYFSKNLSISHRVKPQSNKIQGLKCSGFVKMIVIYRGKSQAKHFMLLEH